MNPSTPAPLPSVAASHITLPAPRLACTGALAFCLLAALGCGGERESLGVARARLNGSFEHLSCEAHEAELGDAESELVSRYVADPGAMMECLRDAFITPYGHRLPPDRVDNLLLDETPTTVLCGEHCNPPSAVACVPTSPFALEGIILQRPTWGNDARQIAGIMLHEIAHTKGFAHPDSTSPEYEYTTTQQLRYCLEAGHPYGPRRSRIHRQTELAPAGAPRTGAISEHSCDAGESIVAGAARFGPGPVAGGEYLTDLALGCSDGPLDPLDVIRSAQVEPDEKGPAETPLLTCPLGTTAIGIYGADRVLDADSIGILGLGLLCSNGKGDVHRVPLGGIFDWQPFERVCPAGMTMHGLTMRQGDVHETLRVICRDPDYVIERPIEVSRVFGEVPEDSESHYVFEDRQRCPGFGALKRIHAPATDRGLDRIGGVCMIEAATPLQADLSVVLPGLGGAGSGQHDSAGCAGDQLMVGARIFSDTVRNQPRIFGIIPLCADVSKWQSEGSSVSPNSAGGRLGVERGDDTEFRCPQGEFVAGLRTHARGPRGQPHYLLDIHGIQLECRTMASLSVVYEPRNPFDFQRPVDLVPLLEPEHSFGL